MPFSFLYTVSVPASEKLEDEFSFRIDKIQHNEVLRINSIVMDFG
jgi:hypothetical protein